MQANSSKSLLAAITAFAFWGVTPLYWKLLSAVPPLEILAHRIFWSFAFMGALVFLLKKTGQVKATVRQILRGKKKLYCLVAGSLFISANWLTFIWAVNSGHILDSSLGYYISPLFSVGLGIVFLGEKLSRPQKIAVILAALGVGYMTVQLDALPWVALTLAFTYGFYGLCKKLVGLDPISGMLLETFLTMPFAVAYLAFLHYSGAASPLSAVTLAFLCGCGLLTVIPLLLFAYSANFLPLSVVGLCQYITPTLSLLIGVLIYGEPFYQVQIISFALIWTGLVIFSVPQVLALRHRKH